MRRSIKREPKDTKYTQREKKSGKNSRSNKPSIVGGKIHRLVELIMVMSEQPDKEETLVRIPTWKKPLNGHLQFPDTTELRSKAKQWISSPHRDTLPSYLIENFTWPK